MRPKLRNAALVGAIAAVTATAWATSGTISNSTYVPHYGVVEQRPAELVRDEPLERDEIAVRDSLSPDETVVTLDERRTATPVAEVDRGISRSGITVEERRLTEDERIQAAVMDRLAGNPRLSGKIGVESQDSVVRLSGYTRTVGQARHAERDARSVIGVRYVKNEIRARVGGSV